MRLPSRLAVITVLMCLLSTAWSQTEGTDMQRLLSRLQSMGHGYYPASEWNRVIEEIQGLVRTAESDGDTGKMVDVSLILAQVYSGMLGQHTRALETVEDLKTRLEAMPAPAAGDHGMAKVYVKLAEIYAQLGDQAAIQQLMDEFRAGPFYDPENYRIDGLSHPDDPAIIRRPFAKGEDSITLSSMNRYLKLARTAPGSQFPGFSGVAIDQRPVQVPSSTFRWVLVDFWVPNWVAWQRDLPSLVATYRRFHDKGFEIIGIPLVPTSSEEITAFTTKHGMAWPQVPGERELAARCGVAGEATNFLVDESGRILARDIRSGDLATLLRNLLAE